MKRSGQVGLVLMGAAAFVGTFAAVRAYQAPAQPVGQPQAAHSCTPRPDGTQSCQTTTQRGFAYYLLPSFMHGSSSPSSAPAPQRAPAMGLSSGAPATAMTSSAAQPAQFRGPVPPAQPAALTSTPRPSSSTSSGTERGGFGTTAKSAPMRVSAGG